MATTTTAIDPALGERIYRTMAMIRTCDERIRSGMMAGEMAFAYWPVEGHEAIAAGAATALEADDQTVITYRGLADAIAKGVPLPDLFGELLGKASGVSKGKAGAMGVSWAATGLMAATGIVGAGAPIANGLALAAQRLGTGRVVLVNFGDGATSIGAVHEAMNLAAVWRLPVVFLCQNNLYGEGTPVAEYTRTAHFADRAAGYGMPGVTVDGSDPLVVHGAVAEAAARARRGDGPTFVEAVACRLQGHYFGDPMAYMDPATVAAARAADPVTTFRTRLLDAGVLTDVRLKEIDEQVTADAEAAVRAALAAPAPAAEQLHRDVYAGRTDAGWRSRPVPAAAPMPEGETREMGLAQAINHALDQALAEDPTVVVLGEDVADPVGGVFTVTKGLSTRHGTDRVRATPIAETAIIGAAVGAAIGGLKPVAEIMFLDFLGVCLDQIANHAAKVRYMSGGRLGAPLTIRITAGAGSGPQHSQALEAWLAHVPGLKVVWPSTAVDAAGLLRACLDDPDPCVFVESMALLFGGGRQAVPLDPFVIPIGLADVKRPGRDVTVVAYGTAVPTALAAAGGLAADGERPVDVEVIDLRSLLPLDVDTVLTSVARTGRAVVAHEAVGFCGIGAEVAAIVSHELHGRLAAPVERVTGEFTPVPRAAELEALHRPGPAAVAAAVRRTLA